MGWDRRDGRWQERDRKEIERRRMYSKSVKDDVKATQMATHKHMDVQWLRYKCTTVELQGGRGLCDAQHALPPASNKKQFGK